MIFYLTSYFDTGSGNWHLSENVTTRGFDLLALPRGARLALGDEAVVEITGLRNPYAQLDGYQKGLTAAVLDCDPDSNLIRTAGVMGIVVTGGVVRPGDAVRVNYTSGAHVVPEPV